MFVFKQVNQILDILILGRDIDLSWIEWLRDQRRRKFVIGKFVFKKVGIVIVGELAPNN